MPEHLETPEVFRCMLKCMLSVVPFTVMQINYGTRTLERVYQLHSAAINCMLVSEGLCVTGSDDKYMRVRPLDFSDFLLEVSMLCSALAAFIKPCNHFVLPLHLRIKSKPL